MILKIPLWHKKIVDDIARVIATSRVIFEQPGTVLRKIYENDELKGIIVLLPNGQQGYFTLPNKNINISTGAKLQIIPEPEVIVQPVLFEKFVHDILRERVLLLPPVWLYKAIKKILNGEEFATKDLKRFPDWIFISPELKKDRQLIDILYRVTQYEGLRGLERFNDKSFN